jgi:hypothetical protein
MPIGLLLAAVAIGLVLAVLFGLGQGRMPPEKTFRCARCLAETPHGKRTAKAWREGKRRFFCRKCHEKWLKEQANAEQAAPARTPARQPAWSLPLAQGQDAPPAKPRGSTPLPAAQKIEPGLDLSNTGHFSSIGQQAALRSWFIRQGIEVRIDPRTVDTTGFFDEAALGIGGNFPLARRVLGAIRWAQREKRQSVQLGLAKDSEADSRALRGFVKKLYEASLVAGHFYDAKKKTLQIQVQGVAEAQRFFNGEWLEWFALMRLLQAAQAQQAPLSCARNVHIGFADGARFELDVFALLGGRPLAIECKSGEWRPFIGKSQSLCKRLGLGAQRFVMCVSGLEDKKLAGLSAMHQLAFANEETLGPLLAQLCQEG